MGCAMAAMLLLAIVFPAPGLHGLDATSTSRLIVTMQRHLGCKALYLVDDSREMAAQTHTMSVHRLVSDVTPSAVVDLSTLQKVVDLEEGPTLIVVMAGHTWAAVSKLLRRPQYYSMLLAQASTHVPQVHVPFHCECFVMVGCDDVTISETYAVSDVTPPRVVPWGRWTAASGLEVWTPAVHRRRSDLQGVTLSATVIEHHPLEVVLETAPGVVHVDGFFPEVVRELGRLLNFSVAVTVTTEEGVLQDNGSWSGSVGMLVGRRAQLALNAFHVTASGFESVDYTMPLVRSRAAIYIRTPTALGDSYAAFLSPLSTSLWLAVAAALMLTTVCVRAVWGWGSPRGHPQPPLMGLTEAFFTTLGILCAQAAYGRHPRWPTRIALWSAHVLATLVIAAYAANMMAYAAVRRPHMPFSSFRGLLEDRTYDFGIEDGGSLHATFQSARDPVLRELYLSKVQSSVQTPAQTPGDPRHHPAFERVCREAFAFMDDYEHYSEVRDLCDLSVLPSPSIPTVFAIAVAKGSPYRGLLDYTLLRLQERGMLRRLRLATWPQPPPPRNNAPTMSTVHLAPLLRGWASAGVLSVVMACAERCCRRRPRPLY